MATESIETEIDLSGKNAGSASTPQGDERPDLEIDVVDDTPEQDRNRPRRKPGTEADIPSDEEIENYSKSVQDRIRQIKWEFHEERRAKEQWQREHQASLDFARRVYDENRKLRELVQSGHKTLLETSKTAAQTEIDALKKSLRNALETGNTEEAAELQAKIAGAAARAEAVNHVRPIQFNDADPDRFVGQQPQAQPPQQRQQVQVSQTMQDWMNDNPWFNTNKRMTSYAFGVHDELIEKGIPPESPRYFQEINKAVREAFPNYYADAEEEDDGDSRQTNSRQREPERRPPRRSVVGVTRAPAGGRPRNKVELTQSQVAVARKLGITNEQYAAELLRLERENG